MNKVVIVFLPIACIFSLCAIVLSIIALCSLNNHTFCSDSALISVLGIMVASLIGAVTILIGWQIFNYLNLEARIKEISDTRINQFVEDFNKYILAVTTAFNDNEIVTCNIRRDKQINAHVESLKKALLCKNVLMRNSAVNYILERIKQPDSEAYIKPEERVIPQGKRNEYIRVLNKVDHNEIDILFEYVTTAIEVDENGKQIINQ